ncbi:MAG TPA: formyltetrahydrofolate deformylase [Solirubrobacteraceae bacterium]|jgi:formyltetrahydrofolate deformylase
MVGSEEISYPSDASVAGEAGALEQPRYSARLLIACPDRPGIVAAVSGFLFEEGANIVSSHQHSTDPADGRFFLRTEFFHDALPEQATELEARFAEKVGEPLQMDWSMRYWGQRQRLAILVSRHDHCLVDLLWRWRRHELDVEMVCVISNHRDLEREVTIASVPFHHVPVEKDRKPEAERQLLELLKGKVDVVVLARYMQILSGELLAELDAPVINIHHSFLPAFAGANPYRRARERGVKLIGATAHYVTAELDGGPIIDQDVERVDHRQRQSDLERVGRDIERVVLARAVALHLEDRVIVDGARTIVL